MVLMKTRAPARLARTIIKLAKVNRRSIAEEMRIALEDHAAKHEAHLKGERP